MRALRVLPVVGLAVVGVSGCAFSMFTSSHDHHEGTQALERRIEALEDRVRCLEQSQTLPHSAGYANPVTLPGTPLPTSEDPQ
ncbi:MAG: hypothetical protein JSS02_18230 [Planctomycetes bacterium]|nr:hypothetical protein [Planctomycetota bacterium]